MATPGIILISHGTLCQELLRSAEMIMGEIEEVETVPLPEGMDTEEYMELLRGALEKYSYHALVLADLFSGTPFNAVLRLSRERDIPLATGVNLAMLMEAANLRDELDSPQEIAAEAAKLGVKGIRWEWDLR